MKKIFIILLLFFNITTVFAESLNVVGNGFPFNSTLNESKKYHIMGLYEKQNGGYNSEYSIESLLEQTDNPFKYTYKGTNVSFLPKSIYLQSNPQADIGMIPVSENISGNIISFSGMFGNNTSYRIVDTPNLIKEELILYKNPFAGNDSDTFIFKHRFNYGNLTPYVNGIAWTGVTKPTTSERIIFKNGTTEYFAFDVPYAIDANGNRTILIYDISKNTQTGEMNIKLNVPMSFLNHNTYPIIIDPSLNQNGGSITLDGTHNYDFVNLTNGAILYITPYNGTGTTGRLTLNITNELNIESGSKINGTATGYRGGAAGDGGSRGGDGGEGTGHGGNSGYRSGGGGGGYGTAGSAGGSGSGSTGGVGGSTYGTSSGDDIDMGSGSGGGGTSDTCTQGSRPSQPGGGMLIVNAYKITIRGTGIVMNGEIGGHAEAGCDAGKKTGGGGGASGGGVKLNATIYDISPSTITAIGGSGNYGDLNWGGSGGGGRIKIFWSGSMSNASTTLSAGTAVYIQTNAPPVMTGNAITPTTAYTSDTLNSSTHTASDVNGNPITFSYQWYENNTLMSGRTSMALDAQYTTKNKIYKVRITPNDGIVDGAATYSNEVTILNTAPTIPTLLQHADFHTLTNTQVNFSSTDNDTDTITYDVKVYNTSTGLLIVNQTNTMNNYSEQFSVENWTSYNYTARSNDGYEYSQWAAVETFGFTNTNLSYSEVILSPVTPTNSNNLTATFTVTDGDGDTITNYTRWYKNGVLQGSLNDSIIVLASGNTSNGEIWQFKVYGNDSYETGSEQFSNQVIIGSSNAPPEFTNLSIEPTKKYNKIIWINASGITDDSTSWQVQAYIWNASIKEYLGNSSWVNGSYINYTVTNPWTSGSKTIYAVIYDSGNVIGEQNLTSSEQLKTFTVDTTAPTATSTSLSATLITIGQSVTITAVLNGIGANITSASVSVERPDATTHNWSMTCGEGETPTCTKSYTSTSDVGTYYIRNFYLTDDSGNLATNVSTLSFNAVTAVVVSGSSPGGSTVTIKETEEVQLPKVLFTNINDTRSLKDLQLIGACLNESLLLSSVCGQSTINIITQPANWWVLISAFLSSIIVLFTLGLIEQRPRKWLLDTGLYGTIAVLVVLGGSTLGFNMFIFSYMFNSPLPAFMSMSFAAYGLFSTLIMDHFSYSTRLAKALTEQGRSTSWAWNK